MMTPLLFMASAFLVGDVQNDIEAVVNQGRGTAAGRAAWERLSKQGPEVLPQVLAAMDTSDIVVANWLRTAFDRIALSSKQCDIDVEALVAFVKDAKHAGRARRFALEFVDRLRPGTGKQLLAGWLDDPEFRYEAVALALERAQELTKSGAKTDAEAEFRRIFTATRDVQQARDAARGLLDLGIKASVAEHLGFLTDWYIIGPFDGMKEKGFHLRYPPEKEINLTAEYGGKNGKIRWQRYVIEEAAPASRAKHQALVDLQSSKALGQVDDAVAYAYTEVTVPQAGTAEFRGAADDNLTVWVNGKRGFGFEEWRNGVRLDRHRFTVPLRQGKNTILVKVCQSEPYIAPNWEFFLRIVDATGKGIAFRNGLAAAK